MLTVGIRGGKVSVHNIDDDVIDLACVELLCCCRRDGGALATLLIGGCWWNRGAILINYELVSNMSNGSATIITNAAHLSCFRAYTPLHLQYPNRTSLNLCCFVKFTSSFLFV